MILCEACFDERCLDHAKTCDDCGRVFCFSIESMCGPTHECVLQEESDAKFEGRDAMNSDLIGKLMDAVNRAMAASPEVRELVRD
jgi:hypothetical protein